MVKRDKDAKMRIQRLMLAGVLAMALAVSGCLDADKISSVSYDAKTDSFTLLRVYYNIHGDAGDVAGLLSMYANRDHILPVEPWSILGEKGLMKIGDEWREVDLGHATLDVAALKPPVDMAGVENKPGSFFTSSDGQVSYYHQVVISGAMMDKLVEWGQAQAQELLAKAAGDEIENRKTGGAKATWDHQRKIMQGGIRGLPEEQREQLGQNETFVVSALNDASLGLLADAQKKGTFLLSRKGSVFHAVGKLSPEDAKEIKDSLAMIRLELQNKIEGGVDATKDTDMTAALIIDSLDVNVAADGTVDVAADISKLGPLVAKLQIAGMKPPADDKKADYANILTGMTDAKVPMEGPMSAAEVVEKFKKGELKANMPEKTVTAGEGLGGDAAKP